MTVVWRIAADTVDYRAEDRTGRGAELTGGRWNRKGTPLIYTSSTRALAALETIVHLNSFGLPLNRYLVEFVIPEPLWSAARMETSATVAVGWDAEPASASSADFGTAWATSNASLILVVPSVVVPEEYNVLLNPRHPDIVEVGVTKIRKWLYDPRLRGQ